MLITRQEYINDKWYVWISEDGLNCDMVTYDHEITEEEAQEYINKKNTPVVLEEPII